MTSEQEPDDTLPVWRDPDVFDPAARHHPASNQRPPASVKDGVGDPMWDDIDFHREWWAARRTVMDHVLRTAAALPGEPLVLRGSVLMEAWFRDAARVPGDVDFLVADRWRRGTVADLGEKLVALLDARRELHVPDVSPFQLWDEAVITGARITKRLDAREYAGTDGVRLEVSWDFPWEGSASTLTVDVAGDDPLGPAVPVAVPTAGGGEPVPMLGASRKAALSWKVFWIAHDCGQAKDVYDAVLLAESMTADDLTGGEYPLGAVWDRGGWRPCDWYPGAAEVVDSDWAALMHHTPWIQGGPSRWTTRCDRAVRRLLALDQDTQEQTRQ